MPIEFPISNSNFLITVSNGYYIIYVKAVGVLRVGPADGTDDQSYLLGSIYVYCLW